MKQSWTNKCTHGNDAQLVMELGKSQVYAGSANEIHELGAQGIAVDLIVSAVRTDKFKSPPTTMNAQASAMLGNVLPEWNEPALVELDWPDMGVPNVSRAWWKALVDHVMDNELIVGVCCMGGHGRTGTMLAIFQGLTDTLPSLPKGPNKDDMVLIVRDAYCESAVESNSQLDYIEMVTGRTTKAEGSKVLSTTGYAYDLGNANKGGSTWTKGKALGAAPVATPNGGTDSQEVADIEVPVKNAAGDIIGWQALSAERVQKLLDEGALLEDLYDYQN